MAWHSDAHWLALIAAVLVPTLPLQSNPEVSEASAFKLPHYRPGTVSLALGENDEEPQLRARPEYRPVEFLITTGGREPGT